MDDSTTTVPVERTGRAPIARIGLLGAVAAALVAAGMLAAAATAAPSGTLAVGDTTGGDPVALQGRGPADGPMGGRFGFGSITITGISGSNVSLKTADGWTRTIAVTGDTTLMEGDATITLSDLNVGDEVRFKQTQENDGTFTVTDLHVVLPHVGGSVTAVDGSTITVTQRDGSTATIKVTSATTYTVGRTDGKALADVTVGMFVGAIGTLNADGSLTASQVHAMDPGSKPGFGDRGGHGPWNMGPGPEGSEDTSAG